MNGVDIEDIERFKNKNQAFLNRVYTKLEQDYCMSKSCPEKHLAARFCAKEAVIKSLSGFGIKDVFMREIEIYHNKFECPCVRLLNNKYPKIKFDLSISHDKTKAIAFVTATGEA